MNGNNAMNDDRLNGSATGLKSVENRQEQNTEWQEPAPTQDALESKPLPWLKAEEIDELQSRWNSIQVEFVDEPLASVEQATGLVAEALGQIEQAFSNQRAWLDEQWMDHKDISTEDLRIALQGYRSFLNRLLAL